MKKSVFILLVIGISGSISGSIFGQVNAQNFNNLTAPANQIVVPPVIGVHIGNAIQQIVEAGLIQGNITEIQSNQPAGIVIRQFPASGQIVSKGTSVNLYVSQGQPPAADPDASGNQPVVVQPDSRTRIPANLMQIQQVTVPQLVGLNYNSDMISARLIRAGLQLGTALPVVDNGKINLVISQEPAAQQRVRLQTRVNITYGIAEQAASSEKPANVIVPNYIGMNIDRVLARLPNDSLTQGAQSEVPSDQAAGIVLEQFPPPESVVDLFTSVSLKLSSGPQPIPQIEVPQLIGHSMQEAAEILISRNLFAGFIKEQVSDRPEGEVLDQSPKAGTLVNAASAIDIKYSVPVRSEYITVPDVSGMPEEKAREVLNLAGLLVEDVYSQKSKEPDRTVISQTPYQDEKVLKGTRAVLIVSENNPPPVWIYWGSGIIVALLVGAYLGWKTGNPRQKKNKTGEKAPKLKLVIMSDAGKQTIYSDSVISEHIIQGLELKVIPDAGIQTIKTT